MNIENTVGAYVWSQVQSIGAQQSSEIVNMTGYPSVTPSYLPTDNLFIGVGRTLTTGTRPFDLIDVRIPVLIFSRDTPIKDVNILSQAIRDGFGAQVKSIAVRLYVEDGASFYDEALGFFVKEITIMASVFGA